MSTSPNVVGYCRACGKGLDQESVRSADGTIYCEEHVPKGTERRVMDNSQSTPQPLPAAAYANPYTAPAPPPIPLHEVSPGLAFVLGMIPGVGAIYNGQYVKGIVHVVIVGLMISLLSSGAAANYEPLMGLMIAAFWAYMCFEAYHTAKRRQQGLIVDEFSSLIPTRSSRFPAVPVMLIALGVIFLLDNLRIIELEHALKYWPLLLIGLGAYMLMARMSDTQEKR
jgi:hypothetical protein